MKKGMDADEGVHPFCSLKIEVVFLTFLMMGLAEKYERLMFPEKKNRKQGGIR